MRERLGRIVIGTNTRGEAITAEDLGVAGAMTVLMKDAIMPNLMQTLEGTPAFVHAGPFANIAHGNSSIVADQIALEAGGQGRLRRDRIRLRRGHRHGEVPGHQVPLFGLDSERDRDRGDDPRAEDARRRAEGRGRPAARQGLHRGESGAARKGLPATWCKHIENAQVFGVPVVVAVNSFKYDTDAEIKLVQKMRWKPAPRARSSARTGCTAARARIELAEAVMAAAKKTNHFEFLYPLDMPIKQKIETIATRIYGADGVDYTPEAEAKIELYTRLGFDKLPICMAKTHLA